MPSEPPPIYSPEPPEDEEALSETAPAWIEPEILIIPTGNDVAFQKGFLGADGERAAIEGELQIKSAQGQSWRRMYAQPLSSFSYPA